MFDMAARFSAIKTQPYNSTILYHVGTENPAKRLDNSALNELSVMVANGFATAVVAAANEVTVIPLLDAKIIKMSYQLILVGTVKTFTCRGHGNGWDYRGSSRRCCTATCGRGHCCTESQGGYGDGIAELLAGGRIGYGRGLSILTSDK
jgi:hypothetical protein